MIFKCRLSSTVEQRYRKPQVVGSNPTDGSIVNNKKKYDSLKNKKEN